MRNTESVLPWICILAVVIICLFKTTDDRICIIGSSGLNLRFKELFEEDPRIINKLTSFLQKENLYGCHEVYILEASNERELLQIRNTEYFMFLLELFDVKHLFRGVISSE